MREPKPDLANGYPVSRDLNPTLVSVSSLSPLGRATRKHPAKQINKLAVSVKEFGFVLPIVADKNGGVIAGWALVQAAKKLNLPKVPVVTITDLSEVQLRALRLALNRMGEDASWDPQELKLEFGELIALDATYDLAMTGFDMGEIDFAVGETLEDEDDLPEPEENTATLVGVGDLWVLGNHAILCGDALASPSYQRLLGDEVAEIIVSDPPYNVPIAGHVSGNGKVKHRDFQMASGEMSGAAFTAFLIGSHGQAARHAKDGVIAYIFIDWRHQREVLDAGDAIFDELKNVCVWRKSNAGMGSLYRSQHEFIYVFKKGKAPHINNIELGRHGRNRSNVWDYPSQSALNFTRKGKLSLHPTVKPVALVADAISDCSNRGGIVLDPFGGSGTTIIAAEKTGRRARLIEIEPRYVEVSIRRWQNLTGRTAVHADTGRLFGA
ncbi:site-specific DNA-methyltransferase [Bauldia litoralis]|uniref:site-specific DNA-methyltransferase n=1 Tax=Bauldia litoralis TaxID=665467 RepID=UPI003266F3BF